MTTTATRHNCADHKQNVARVRGNKVRYQCSVCQHMHPWEKDEAAAKASKPAKGEVPVRFIPTVRNPKTESVRPKMTPKVNLPAAKSAEQLQEVYNGWIIADLKDHAKRHGVSLTGVTKKADIIRALVASKVQV